MDAREEIVVTVVAVRLAATALRVAELVHEVRAGDAQRVGQYLHPEPPKGGGSKRKGGFWAGVLQRLAEDLCLHGLKAEQALKFVDLAF
jgi:hypothetical protein